MLCTKCAKMFTDCLFNCWGVVNSVINDPSHCIRAIFQADFVIQFQRIFSNDSLVNTVVTSFINI